MTNFWCFPCISEDLDESHKSTSTDITLEIFIKIGKTLMFRFNKKTFKNWPQNIPINQKYCHNQIVDVSDLPN
jgi:hypothetical protein